MSPLPVARKESASLPASRLAMMLPNDVETRIPPAMLLTLMPPEPLSHCTPAAAPTFTGARQVTHRDDAIGGIDNDLAAAVSGGHRTAGFNNVDTAAAGIGAHRAADVRGGDVSAHGFQYGGSTHRTDLDLPGAART